MVLPLLVSQEKQGAVGRRGNVDVPKCHLTGCWEGTQRPQRSFQTRTNSVILQPHLCFGSRNREKGGKCCRGAGDRRGWCPQPPAQEGFHLQLTGTAGSALRQNKQQGGCSVQLHRIWVVLGHKTHSFFPRIISSEVRETPLGKAYIVS